jgi:hypothetical protein
MATRYDELGVVILDAADTNYILVPGDTVLNVLGNAGNN